MTAIYVAVLAMWIGLAVVIVVEAVVILVLGLCAKSRRKISRRKNSD